MEREYYREIDIVKGIAILLVILGHSFCNFPFDLARQCPKLLIEIVCAFQLSLFFMASGFLFSWHGSFGDFAKNKVKRLLIPYLTFGVASFVLRLCFNSFTRSGEISIIQGIGKIVTGEFYWFIYALLLIMIVMRFVKRPIGWAIIALSSIIVGLFTTIQEDISIFTIGRSVYFIFFFICGILIKVLYPRVLQLFKQPLGGGICAILLLIYVLSLAYGKYDHTNLVEKYLLPLSGSFLTWCLSIMWVLYGSYSRFMSVFVHFGKYSLQYYLNHLLIMLPVYYAVYAFRINIPLISLLLIFSIAVAVSWTMLRIEMKIPLIRALCGLKAKKNDIIVQ